MSDSVAQDGVVRLRPLRASDAKAHLDGCDQRIVDRLAGGVRPTMGQVEDWLRANATAWAEAGPVVDLGIEENSSGMLAGCVGIQRGLDYLSAGQVNLSYALYPAFRGHGYGTRSVRLAMQVAVSQGSVSEFIIGVTTDNVASVRVAERLGFRPVGTDAPASEPLCWYVRPGPAASR